MLSYSKTDNGNFLITETSLSFTSTEVMAVEYDTEIGLKRVNQDPWRETTASDRAWFNKWYRGKFDA